jgi:hypothetical protein
MTVGLSAIHRAGGISKLPHDAILSIIRVECMKFMTMKGILDNSGCAIDASIGRTSRDHAQQSPTRVHCNGILQRAS